METNEIIEKLKRYTGGVEVYQVTFFELFRDTSAGLQQEVTVKIKDRGPDAGNNRYHINVTSNDGKAASGNSAADLETALMNVQWQALK